MTATITTLCRDKESYLGCRCHNAKYWPQYDHETRCVKITADKVLKIKIMYNLNTISRKTPNGIMDALFKKIKKKKKKKKSPKNDYFPKDLWLFDCQLSNSQLFNFSLPTSIF